MTIIFTRIRLLFKIFVFVIRSTISRLSEAMKNILKKDWINGEKGNSKKNLRGEKVVNGYFMPGNEPKNPKPTDKHSALFQCPKDYGVCVFW